jgi:hypothetical protein
MSSDLATDITTKAGILRTPERPKRQRVQYQGDESITSAPRAKHQRSNATILQPHDSNVRPQDQVTRLKATPPSLTSCSDVPREFEYSESEIKVLRVIGSGDHAVVYRIAAGGRTFALKVVSTRTLYKNSCMSNEL